MSNHTKTDNDWKKLLSDESFRVTRQSGTERPFTGKYWNFNEDGIYKCICCGESLFESDTKFDAGCGWPSFFVPVDSVEGKTAIIQGDLFLDTTSVEMLKHYAEDAGKSEEEITLITEPSFELGFIADGVIIKE